MEKENIESAIFSKLSMKDVMSSPEKSKARQLILSGLLQCVFLPAASGFLATGILVSGLFKKLSLDRFDFINFPTILIDTTTSSTYSGLMFVAGLGCIVGLILYKIMKYIAKFIPAVKFLLFDFVKPLAQDAMPIPSVTSLIKSLLKLIGIPAIILLASVTARDLAKTGLLPGVGIDLEYQLFEVTSEGLIIVAAIGCFLVFLFDAGLTILLNMIGRKKEQTKEIYY